MAVAVALVLVPAVARARQHVDQRDATRLSIKHNWIGVAPPTKAIVAPQSIVVIAAVAAAPEPHSLSRLAVITPAPALHPVLQFSRDPLRGPPSIA